MLEHMTQASPLVEILKPEAQDVQNPLRLQATQLEIKQKEVQTFPESWYPNTHWEQVVPLQAIQLVMPQLGKQLELAAL
jgi:hypothetical protein